LGGFLASWCIYGAKVFGSTVIQNFSPYDVDDLCMVVSALLGVETSDGFAERLGYGGKLAGADPDVIAAARHFSCRAIEQY
jgi:hypothetical protein